MKESHGTADPENSPLAWLNQVDADAVKLAEDAEKARQGVPILWNYTPLTKTPVISANGCTLIFRNQLMTIVAPKGTGKTQVVEAIVCGAWAAGLGGISEVDSLGFEFDLADERPVIYLDYERDKDDCHDSMQRIVSRLRIPEGHECLNKDGSIQNLIFLSCKQLTDAATRQGEIDRMLELNPKLLILDGGLLLVRNYNDLEECMQFVSELSAKAEARNCGMVITLHPNKAKEQAENAAGHLGSALLNYSRCVAFMKFYSAESDIRLIVIDQKIIHQAKTSKGAGTTLAITWCNESHMMVSCDVPDDSGSSRPGPAKWSMTYESISESIKALTLKHGELIPSKAFKTSVQSLSGKSVRTISDAIQSAIISGWIQSEGDGKSTRYRILKPLKNDDEMPF